MHTLNFCSLENIHSSLPFLYLSVSDVVNPSQVAGPPLKWLPPKPQRGTPQNVGWGCAAPFSKP